MSESFSTISPRKSHARVKSGEDMMDVLAHDIMRYEMLSEQDEYKALASILQGIKVITKLPNSEQSYKGKVKTHNYINRQNQSTTGKLKTVMTLTWYRHF